MSLESITEKVMTKFRYAGNINARVLLDCGDDGQVLIDATQSPPEIRPGETEADVTLAASKETLEKILDGAQDPSIAFMTGKLKIRGSMGLAMKLNGILEG